jgi:hypothetical protein
MTDIGTLVLSAIDVLAIGGLIAIVNWLARGEGGSLADLFAIPLNPPLPRGIQEEEPQAWHIERLAPRAGAVGAPRGLELRRQANGHATRASIATD